MAKFEDRGYCPFNEIIDSEEKVWKELTDCEKGHRRSLWNLVGPYMVCDLQGRSYTVESGKLFFNTRYLANDVLNEIIKRYDFDVKAPIWIRQPRNGNSSEVNIAEYVLSSKKPEILFDAGVLAVVSNGEEGELIIAFWDRTF